MAKLSPFQRRVLTQIVTSEASPTAQPLLPLGTIKTLMIRGLIKRELGPSHDRLVVTTAGRAALSDILR